MIITELAELRSRIRRINSLTLLWHTAAWTPLHVQIYFNSEKSCHHEKKTQLLRKDEKMIPLIVALLCTLVSEHSAHSGSIL